MRHAVGICVLGGAAALLLGAGYLWSVRGSAIVLDYIFAGCL